MNKWEKAVIEAQIESEKAVLRALEKQYKQALTDIGEKIKALQADELTQSKIYQIQYQKALRGQVAGILDKLHGDEYSSIQKYLSDCYNQGFLGTMYSIHKQGVPIISPIDQAAAVRAVQLDSKISKGLYTSLGIDINKMKRTISAEVTRGISSSLPYADIARNIDAASGSGLFNARRIARTEGHRIQQASAADARQEAKRKGADVVKQWDATLDGKTRETHRELDGKIVAIDEDFTCSAGSTPYPGGFGDPAEDCNCRCVALTRAKWGLDAAELNTLKERAAYFGLDKTADFNDFQDKYIEASKPQNNILYCENERASKDIQYAIETSMLDSREYADKFNLIGETEEEKREFLKAAKEILHHRSGQNGEDLYLYNRVSKVWYKATDGKEAGRPQYTNALNSAISKAKPGSLIAFHNHPANMPPSINDINNSKYNKYGKGIILCHNGTIYEYTPPLKYIDDSAYLIRIEKFKKLGYNEFEAQTKTIEHFSKIYDFIFREVK